MAAADPDWPELSRLLDLALERAPEEREAFVDALPPGQARLARRLRDILVKGARRAGPGFLEHLPAAGGSAAPGAGAHVGPYVLLRELGHGGMGAVWLAERADGRPARRIALKLPRWAADPAALQRRMARERDTLGALEHPHIARLYDAGVDEAGRPWLAMEYVDGAPLDVHAAARKLGVRERLGLFLQIADAVACAHARLVVHRDLKPANVLVNDDGEVRLLDFGIAKLLDAEPGGDSQTSELAGLAFTPDYAAPEQLSGGTITVATDVYALGVMLYELLSGQRPYALERGLPGGLERALEQARPPRPSEVAPPILRAALRGDLDVIVAKAMKLAPGERYQTVAELATDLRHHLAGEPVLARPDGTWYRTTKFVGRHRLAVALAAGVLLALGAGLWATLWQARQAIAARDRAEALLARSLAVGEAMDHVVQQAAAELRPEALKRVIDASADLARASFVDAPEREALVLIGLASYHEAANDRSQAVALLDRAELRLAGSGDRDLVAQVACKRATWAQDTPEAAGRLEQTRRLGEDAALAPTTRIDCLAAATLLAQHEAPPEVGLALADRARAALVDVKVPTPRLRALVLWRLGEAEAFADRGQAARKHLEEALHLLEEAGLGTSSDALQIHHTLSDLLMMHGVYVAALPHIEVILAAFADRPPPDVVVSNFAFALDGLGRSELALTQFERSAELARRAGNAWAEAQVLAGQANVLRRQLRLDEARRRVVAAERLASAELNANSPATSYTRYVRGLVELDAGRLEEARRYAALLFDPVGRQPSPSGRNNAHRLRALVALAAGDLTAALADARAALDAARVRRAHELHSMHVGRAQLLVGQIEERAGRGPEALAAYRDAREQLAASCGDGHADTRLAAEGVRRLGGPGQP